MTNSIFANRDQELIYSFLTRPDHVLTVDSNPMAIALGAQLLLVNIEIGSVEMGFTPDRLFIQGTGVLQGGAVSAMLDFAMAFAALAHLPAGHSCATVNMNTTFLRPAPQGRYIAVGEVERRGRSLAFTQARLLRADDRQAVATATSTLAIVAPA